MPCLNDGHPAAAPAAAPTADAPPFAHFGGANGGGLPAPSAALSEKFKDALLVARGDGGVTMLLAAAAAGAGALAAESNPRPPRALENCLIWWRLPSPNTAGALVRALLENGADETARNVEGENAMHLAAKGCHREALHALFEHSDLPILGPNAQDSNGRTPLDVSPGDFGEELEMMWRATKSPLMVPLSRLPSKALADKVQPTRAPTVRAPPSVADW
eukprot:5299288-Prymnesium_polylepis.1